MAIEQWRATGAPLSLHGGRFCVTPLTIRRNNTTHHNKEYRMQHLYRSLFCLVAYLYIRIIDYPTQSSTMQHYTALCSTMQHYTVLCSTIQHYAVLCSTMQHYTVLCSTMQHYAALCSTIQHSAALFSTMQHYATLYSTMRIIQHYAAL